MSEGYINAGRTEDLPADDGGHPILAEVPSSKGTGAYKVRRTPDGVLICPCPGFSHRGKCRHLEEAIIIAKNRQTLAAQLAAAEAVAEAADPELQFELRVTSYSEADPFSLVVVPGSMIRTSALRPGDLERLTVLEEWLSRLLGMTVQITTGDGGE